MVTGALPTPDPIDEKQRGLHYGLCDELNEVSRAVLLPMRADLVALATTPALPTLSHCLSPTF